MKLKYAFTVRDIAGEYVLVPSGKDALAFSGMLTTNAVGALICEKLRENVSLDQLVSAVISEFDIDPETARADTRDLVAAMEKAGLLE